MEITKQRRWEEAIVSLQARHRGNLVREDMEYVHYCAKQIQAQFRRWKAHNQRTTYLAIQLQAMFRGKITRRKLDSHVKSAIAIQSYWRSFVCRIDFELAIMDITIVQSVARRWLILRRIRNLNVTDMSNELLYNSLELSFGEESHVDLRQTSLSGEVLAFEESFDEAVKKLQKEIEMLQKETQELW
jgi:myosin heavy subunit